jgi:hypothetical protein
MERCGEAFVLADQKPPAVGIRVIGKDWSEVSRVDRRQGVEASRRRREDQRGR